LRLDAFAERQALARPATLGASRESRERWQPALALSAEGSWAFTAGAALVAAAGGRMTTGQTEVLVGGKELARLPPAALQLELGLRALF
jgi:hypothetical protein